MPDMLIKLYDLEDDWGFLTEQKKRGIIIRKPIGPEKKVLVDWVTANFGPSWASETDVAVCGRSRSCFVAVREAMFIGVACYDATALGFLGPIGVEKTHRKNGIGKALLTACLLDMKLKGYGYAVVGAVKDTAFFKHTVSAIEIPDSSPGIYGTWVRDADTEG